MRVEPTPAEQADPLRASAAACVSRASRALERADLDQAPGRRECHDLRSGLGTLVAALQVLDCTPAGSDLAAEAREILRRQVRHIDGLLDQPPWGPGREAR